MQDKRLLLFVKYAEEGRVKTRLAQKVGRKTAAALYRCFVSDTLALSRRAGCRTSVFFHPPEAKGAMIRWLGPDLTYVPQTGNDLGERMCAAFQEAFRDGSRAVLMGTDIPDLPQEILLEAFDGLETFDAVIGPALDGGYYLIGLSSAGLRPSLFHRLPWGSPSVLERTLRILEERRLRFHLLPEWGDIDEVDDLAAFFQRGKDLPRGTLASIDFLRDQGW